MAREAQKTALILPEDADSVEDESALDTTLLSDADQETATLTILMQQFQALQRTLVDVGVGRIAADGSFLLGRQLEQKRTREKLGSACTCAQCKPWDQHHWLCYVCGSGPHEWKTRAPRTMRPVMNVGGISGVLHAVCSDRCGRDYAESLGRIPSGEPQVPQVPVERLPRAGGDDGLGFMELQQS